MVGITKRLKKIVEHHDNPGELPRKLLVELGEDHTDALHRLALLMGTSKVSVLRALIDEHLEQMKGGILLVSNPSQLLHAVETGSF